MNIELNSSQKAHFNFHKVDTLYNKIYNSKKNNLSPFQRDNKRIKNVEKDFNLNTDKQLNENECIKQQRQRKSKQGHGEILDESNEQSVFNSFSSYNRIAYATSLDPQNSIFNQTAKFGGEDSFESQQSTSKARYLSPHFPKVKQANTLPEYGELIPIKCFNQERTVNYTSSLSQGIELTTFPVTTSASYSSIRTIQAFQSTFGKIRQPQNKLDERINQTNFIKANNRPVINLQRLPLDQIDLPKSSKSAERNQKYQCQAYKIFPKKGKKAKLDQSISNWNIFQKNKQNLQIESPQNLEEYPFFNSSPQSKNNISSQIPNRKNATNTQFNESPLRCQTEQGRFQEIRFLKSTEGVRSSSPRSGKVKVLPVRLNGGMLLDFPSLKSREGSANQRKTRFDFKERESSSSFIQSLK